jgi:hypothetical protein
MSRDLHRSGVVLILAVGLVALLAVLAVTFLMRMKRDAEEVQVPYREVQCRIAFVAALQYLQESSRLGWGEETFGWTDLRHGLTLAQRAGPRGPRRADGKLPDPPWGSSLPSLSSRRWPAPGSVLRAGLDPWVRPPFAIDQSWSGNLVDLAAAQKTPAGGGVGSDSITPATLAAWAAGRGAKDPVPAVADQNAWANGARDAGGEPLFSATGRGLAWIRIYREDVADHDNNQTDVAGNPSFHDTIPAPGDWGIFIIAVGAGGSRGYRFWDAGDPGYSAELEPATASADPAFSGDQSLFKSLRADEHILWYRVAWSPRMPSGLASGSASPDEVRERMPEMTAQHKRLPIFEGYQGGDTGSSSSVQRYAGATRSFGGVFAWIQRLDREPSRW